MLVKSFTGVIFILPAHTGAPIIPSNIFTPTVRRKVLFPAILAPVMINTCPVCMTEKLLQILVPTTSRGCPIASASRRGPPVAVQGKGIIRVVKSEICKTIKPVDPAKKVQPDRQVGGSRTPPFFKPYNAVKIPEKEPVEYQSDKQVQPVVKCPDNTIQFLYFARNGNPARTKLFLYAGQNIRGEGFVIKRL